MISFSIIHYFATSLLYKLFKPFLSRIKLEEKKPNYHDTLNIIFLSEFRVGEITPDAIMNNTFILF